MKGFSLFKSLFRISFLFVCISVCWSGLAAQDKEEKMKLSTDAKRAREYALNILDEMEDDLREYYYDQTFHGIDLKNRIEAAKVRVKTLQYNWQMYRVLVQVLMEFNDSHTTMILPPRTDHFQYGFAMQMIGDECYVTSIRKDSDAHQQGVEVGDQITALGKFTPNRRDLWKMQYVLFKLDPANTLDLKIRKPDGTEKSMTVKAKVMTEKEFRAELKAHKDDPKYEPAKCQEINKDVVACKLKTFVVEKSDIDKMMKTAAKYPKLILDLRGNRGGYVFIEEYLLSYFFDKEIKIGDMITKDKKETRKTKPLGDKQYKGEVSVLIDSDSASAAEMTSRVLQIQKRAKIYGDVSSGSVMTSIRLAFSSVMGALMNAAIIQVGMSMTIGDVIMSDGSRIEHVGVIPDEILQPTGLGLAKKTDAVLAYTAMKLGAELTPETAGSFHFLVEKAEDEDNEEDSK